jgi:uncharacterized protein YciI
MASEPKSEFKSMIEQLTGKMLNKRLYVVIWKSFGKPDLIRANLEQHLHYMIGMEKRGALFASGPFTPGNGASIGDGMSVFRAVSLDEAKVFANSDPFVLAGARTYDIREWTIMEGSIGITVGFSEGGYRID